MEDQEVLFLVRRTSHFSFNEMGVLVEVVRSEDIASCSCVNGHHNFWLALHMDDLSKYTGMIRVEIETAKFIAR